MALTPASERFLRYWSANMGVAWESTGSTWWPGFNYTDAERTRMQALTEPLAGKAVLTFFSVTTVGFLIFAAIAIAVIMVPALTLLYPDPSKLQPLPFVLIMASVIAVCMGIGLPLVVMAGAWAGDAWGGGRPADPAPGDGALYAKIRWQFIRMTIVMVCVFIPGCLAFILFQIDGGPLIFWGKIVLIAFTLASLGGLIRQNRH